MFIARRNPLSSKRQPSFSNSTPKANTSFVSRSSVPRSHKKRSVQTRTRREVFHENERHRIYLYSPIPTEIYQVDQDGGTEYAGIIHGSGVAFVATSDKFFSWELGAHSKRVISFPAPPTQFKFCSSRMCIVPRGVTNSYIIGLGYLVSSQEGNIRYWPNIKDPDTYHDTALDIELKTLKCCPQGALLGSSDGKLFYASLWDSNRQMSSLQVFSVSKPSSGGLRGLGRRMLWWGSSSDDSIRCIAPLFETGHSTLAKDDLASFLVLTSNSIQRWVKDEQAGNAVVLTYEEAILGMLEQHLSVGGRESKLWLCDLKPARNGLFYLLVYWEQADHATGNYFVVACSFQRSVVHVESSFRLPFDPPGQTEAEIVSAELLLSPSSTAAYVRWKNQMIFTQVPVDERPLDSMQEALIATGILDDSTALAISLRYGVLAMEQKLDTSTPFPSFRALPASSSLSMSERQQFSMLLRTYPSKPVSVVKRDLDSFSNLDETVLSFSRLVLNTASPGDPRWADDSSDSLVGSMILLQQLEEKKALHGQLVTFLTDVGVLSELRVSTLAKLREHAEKLQAALALRTLQNTQESVDSGSSSTNLLNRAIVRSLNQRTSPETWNSGLSQQDVFYREVESVNSIFSYIQQLLRDVIQGEQAEDRFLTSSLPQSIISLSFVNQVFEDMLSAVLKYRLGFPFTFPDTFSPWTATDSFLLHLSQQIHITSAILVDLNKLLPTEISEDLYTEAEAMKEQLLSQLANLGDVYLDFLHSRLLADHNQATDLFGHERSAKEEQVQQLEKRFSEERSKILSVFVTNRKSGVAFQLAEKFRDFDILIGLCEDEQNTTDLLQHYCTIYKESDFELSLFQWYLSRSAYSKLLSLPEELNGRLESFLEPHPELGWLHAVRIKDYAKTSRLLIEEAAQERFSSARRKTMASLSKLASLANDLATDSSIQNEWLHLSKAQERLQARLGEEFPPMSVEEVILKSLDCEEVTAAEILFALDTLSHGRRLLSSDKQENELELKIWISALLSTDWVALAKEYMLKTDDTSIEAAIRESVFFQAAGLSSSVASQFSHELQPAILKTWWDEMSKQADKKGESITPDMVPTLKRLMETVLAFVEHHQASQTLKHTMDVEA